MRKSKRIIACIVLCAMLFTTAAGAFPTIKAQAASKKYLVLVEHSNGVWIGYKNLAYQGSNGGIYVYAKDTAKALGYTYKNLGNGKFRIKSGSKYLQYTKGKKAYTFYKNTGREKSTGLLL